MLDVKALGDGGSFYIKNSGFSTTVESGLTITDSAAIGSTAVTDGYGGVFYCEACGTISIKGSTFEVLDANLEGAFLYSQYASLTVITDDVIIDCINAYSTFAALTASGGALYGTPAANNPGAFWVEGASGANDDVVITQKGGIVENCFNANKGGAYTMINAKLITSVDTKASNAATAKIKYTAAVKGGAIYCQNCILSLTDIEFYKTAAEFGGVIYAEDQAAITLTRSDVKYSIAV